MGTSQVGYQGVERFVHTEEVGHTQKTFLFYPHRQRHFSSWLAEQGLPNPPIHAITPEPV